MPSIDHDHLPRGRSLHKLRVQLSESEALPQLTLLGLIIGIIAGALLIAFRELVSFSTSFWLPLGDEHFETLPVFARFALPIAGALVIYLMFRFVPAQQRTVGILHVVERLTFHKGRMALTGVILQFLGALTALVSGFSVGREGPAVHMGAAILQAPLAALITVLELTRNPHIIMPAMFAIIIACLVAGRLTGSQGGLVGKQLAARGHSLQQSPMYQLLNRTGVASLMETNYCIQPAEKFSDPTFDKLTSHWVILELEGRYTTIINNRGRDTQTPPEPDSMQPVQIISIQATLHDALETMQRHSVSTLCVYSLSRRRKHLCGVITREAIEKEIGSTIS